VSIYHKTLLNCIAYLPVSDVVLNNRLLYTNGYSKKESVMKNFRPLILFVAFVFFVSLACNALSGGGDTPAQPAQPAEPVQPAEPAQPQQEEPQAPVQDEPATDEPAPVDEPAQSMYFTEEFDQDPGWDYFLTAGDEDKITVEFEDSLMIFDLDDVDIYAYYLYELQEYEDVRVDMRAENRGKNNNNVSLICRASLEGWYEFSTEGGGLWYLYAVTVNESNEPIYNRLDKGGAASLKQGKEVNEYGMICEGREITLIVNGKEIKTIKDSKFDIRKGGVGFNISSLNVTPIIVDVDWFKVSEP
jgi:hypothetical protein